MTPDPNTIDYLRDTINEAWKDNFGGHPVSDIQVLANRVRLMSEAMIRREKEDKHLLDVLCGKIES